MTCDSPLRVDYASSALNDVDAIVKIDTARFFCDKQGWQFGIQVHNSENRWGIRRHIRWEVPLSWHGPLRSRYFMNFASADPTLARRSARKTAGIIGRWQSKFQQGLMSRGQDGQAAELPPPVTVFHGFLMTDYPVRAFNRRLDFEVAMRAGARPELHHEDGRLIKPYYDSPEHAERLERVKNGCRWLRETYPHVMWCIEDDFPVYGGGNLLARHLVALEAPVCVDTSHLWTTCALFDKDFHAEAEELAASGRVRCVHLHASGLTRENPGRWLDGHRPLDTENQMDLRRFVRTFHEAGMRHWVLETPRASVVDLQKMAEWLG